MGRTKDDIWTYYDLSNTSSSDPDPAKKRITAKCKYCPFELKFANASRLTEHLQSDCAGCPEVVKSAVKLSHPHHKSNKPNALKRKSNSNCELEEEDEFELGVVSPSSSSNGFSPLPSPCVSPAPSASSTSAGTKPKRTGNLLHFIDQMSPSEQATHETNFTRAMIATRCPLSMFEHPLWKHALVSLRKSFKPPGRKAVGGRLLDQEYNMIMKAANQKIKEAPALGLTSDGWKNTRGDGLVNFVILTPEPVFFKIVDTKDAREDGEYVAAEIIKIIDEIGDKKFCLVITDNAAYNKVAWRIIEEKYPHITAVGDPAHALNLLMHDMLEITSFLKVEKMSKMLYKGIKLHKRPLAYFNKERENIFGKQSKTLKLPSATRFSGTLLFFESIQCNKRALESTVLAGTSLKKPRDPEEQKKFYIPPKTRDICLDTNYYWPRLSAWISVLKPISVALALVESDSVLLSDIPEAFYSIKTECTAALSEQPDLKKFTARIQSMIRERKQFVCKDIHFAANLLDPRYQGRSLNREEKVGAAEFIAKMCDQLLYTAEQKEQVLANLAEFRAGAGIWSRESVMGAWKNITPSVWWRGTCGDEPLCPLAVKLLTIPPSSASTERGWSFCGMTHTKTRNRLLNKKVQKMVAVQMNLQYAVPSNMLPKPKKVSRTGPLFRQPDDGHEVEAQEEGNDTGESSDSETVLDSDEEITDEDWPEMSSDESEDDLPIANILNAPVATSTSARPARASNRTRRGRRRQ